MYVITLITTIIAGVIVGCTWALAAVPKVEL